MDVVLLFPGQGSQKPGMGKDLAEAFPAARAVFAACDDTLGERLSQLCFEGPADALTLTHNAQPALLAHGAAVWAVVREALGAHARAAAGHSLGEFTAYHAAGALPLTDAVRLVRRRGALMSEAAAARPGAMAAIVGEMHEAIEAVCERASHDPQGGLVVAANYNSPSQTVISGEVAGVERGMELCKAAGARRALRLTVSGAFHSPLMAPARDGLSQALEAAAFVDPTLPVYANVSATAVDNARDARALCLEQLTAPVCWTELVKRLAHDLPGALFVELGPGSVLSGLVRHIVPDAETARCGTADDVRHLLERLS